MLGRVASVPRAPGDFYEREKTPWRASHATGARGRSRGLDDILRRRIVPFSHLVSHLAVTLTRLLLE